MPCQLTLSLTEKEFLLAIMSLNLMVSPIRKVNHITEGQSFCRALHSCYQVVLARTRLKRLQQKNPLTVLTVNFYRELIEAQASAERIAV